MKRKFILSVILALSTIMTQAAVNAVRMTPATGEEVTFQLEDVPTVTIEGSELVVTAGETVVRCNFSGAVSFKLVDTASSAIKAVADDTNHLFYKLSGSQLSISGLKAYDEIAVFNLAGQLITKTQADAQGNSDIELLAKGRQTYIIKTTSKTIKITK